MSDFFREKYIEIILYKQESLAKYQLAVENLLTAMQKKINRQNDENLIPEEFVKNLYNTVNELKNIQFKKIGLKANPSFNFDNDFSYILDSQPSLTPKEFQNELSNALESIQQPSFSISINKEQKIKVHKKNPTIKITLKNNAPLPPPWIP